MGKHPAALSSGQALMWVSQTLVGFWSEAFSMCSLSLAANSASRMAMGVSPAMDSIADNGMFAANGPSDSVILEFLKLLQSGCD